ncbi:MAG: PorV/PorQ family protein [candidate division WOR-3 bacterium]
MNRQLFILPIVLCLLSSGASGARQVGCAWLQIPVSAREAAMAGTGTATGFGPQAVAFNPAASAGVSPFSVQAGYTKWLLDTHHQTVFACRDLRHFVLGIGIVTFANGRFEYRDERPTAEPRGTFFPLDLTGYLNLSRRLAPIADFGISGRYFYSKIMQSEAAGFGGDIGCRFYPIKNLTLGTAIIDFGKTMSYSYEIFWLPTRANIGAGYNLPLGSHLINLAIDCSYLFYTKKLNYALGTEFTLADIISFRAGYNFTNRTNNLNFGLGISRGLFHLDYAFSPLGFNLGSAHRITLGFGY